VAAPPSSSGPRASPKKKKEAVRTGFFGRIGGFFREVVSELRKVIWPTRKELLTYTTIVIVFVTIMTAIVGVLDYGFGKAILWAFGGKLTRRLIWK
jgi:preprotein translocase subunit SecE